MASSATLVAGDRVGAPAGFARSRWPFHEADEIAAVAEVLRSGRVNALHHGEQCRGFEQGFAARIGVPHAIALSNGTVALELALKALGIGKGDEVVVTPRSFVASAACVVAVGATPVFADIDPDSQNITAASIAAVLTPRSRAVIPVHLAGWPCDMPAIMALAEANGLKVIEDCAQAHGAMVGGRAAGSFGDAATFSFCTDKIMSTGGEGGLLVMRDAHAHGLAWSLKDHGKINGPPAAAGPAFRWLHHRFGSNYRMTEMQAAIGWRQLEKLDGWLAARRANAMALAKALALAPALRVPLPGPNVTHAFYKLHAFVRPERLAAGATRDAIIARAQADGLPCFSGGCPEIYRENCFVAAGIGPEAPLPVARRLGETSLMLPVDPSFTPAEMTEIGSHLAGIVRAASA